MFTRIRFLFLALILPAVLISSDVAFAQHRGGGSGHSTLGVAPGNRSRGGFANSGRAYVGGYGGNGFFDSGIGAFGGGRPPGAAFGFNSSYLAQRAFTAGGVVGGLTYGTPQPPEPEVPPSTALARAASAISNSPFMNSMSTAAPATSEPASTATTTSSAPPDKVLVGETAFQNGDYPAAIEDWKSAITDGSSNPVLVQLLGQAYFAAGQYQDAAAAIQAAMHALPEDRWGLVISNRGELYKKQSSYIFQLQQLEDAVKDRPRDPAQRFLLAYHYAYLGYPTAAVAQLDKVVELDPRNEMATQLRQTVGRDLPDPAAPVITPGGGATARR